MYAVIRTGGKQYRVAKDEVVTVERLAGEPGASIELGEILMLDDGSGPTIGAPLVAGARVTATVLEQRRAEKILVFKKKRRKNYRRTRGHRQEVTVLRVTDILASGRAKPARAAAESKATESEAAADQPAASEE